MTSYIGTATSRIDGRAKVTGAAKYAGEFNTVGLAHDCAVFRADLGWPAVERGAGHRQQPTLP